MSTSKKNQKPETFINRTTISESGELKEHNVPLSKLWTNAINLASPFGMLLLTEDAAVRITEKAISTALENMLENDLKQYAKGDLPDPDASKNVTPTPSQN